MKLLRFGAAAALFVTACGYRPALAGAARPTRLTLVAAPFLAPHPEAVEAALAGARMELSRAGALAPGDSYPRLVVEVLRVDEVAAAIRSEQSAAGPVPLGHASAVGVAVHGFILERAGGEPVRDTGDIRRVETVAQGVDSVSGAVAYEAAVRAAARRAGEGLARRALGTAEPSVEPM